MGIAAHVITWESFFPIGNLPMGTTPWEFYPGGLQKELAAHAPRRPRLSGFAVRGARPSNCSQAAARRGGTRRPSQLTPQ